AAADLRDTGRDAGVATGGNERANWLRANARRLGLIASGYGVGEPGHYDIPDMFRTPPTTPGTAGGNAKPINTNTPTPESEEEDEDMRFKFGHRTDGTTDEWMIVHPSIKGGYQVTTNQKRAIAWARLYGRGWLADENARYDFNVPRDEYIELQNAARAVASGWVG